jgi:hypothetical protein
MIQAAEECSRIKGPKRGSVSIFWFTAGSRESSFDKVMTVFVLVMNPMNDQ